jgi:hypothetical protein
LKIKHVAQEHDKGCVIACIAMVLGWDYQVVAAEFHNDFNKSGINIDFAADFLGEHGFSVIEKSGTRYLDLAAHNRRMMQPFAPIHLVSVQQFVDKPKTTHCVVMDAKGKIYDPADKNAKDILYYSVHSVLGFFDERPAPQKRKR